MKKRPRMHSPLLRQLEWELQGWRQREIMILSASVAHAAKNYREHPTPENHQTLGALVRRLHRVENGKATVPSPSPEA